MKKEKAIKILDSNIRRNEGDKDISKIDPKLIIEATKLLLREFENLHISSASVSLLRSKAKEYAKFKHQDEYNDPIYYRDVLETLNDFEVGYKAALKDYNEL